MGKLTEIVLTSSLTVITGTTLFIISDLFKKFILDPAYRQKDLYSEIASALIFYADYYSNPGMNDLEEARLVRNELRLLSTKLIANTSHVKFFERIFHCTKKDVADAASELLRISNSLYASAAGSSSRNTESAKKIVKLLKLDIELD